jgi:PAS domain S-box-containing protein
MTSLTEAEENAKNTISGTGTENMAFRLNEREPGLWLLEVRGKCLSGDAKKILDAVEKAVPPGAKAHMIIDLNGFEKFPINERKMVFERYQKFNKEERFEFTCLINPNPFIRMVALLVGVVYKEIPFSLETSFNEAYRRFDTKKQEQLTDAELVRDAIDSGNSNHFAKISWRQIIPHPEKDGHYLNLIAFEPNIIFIQYVGNIHGDQASRSIEILEEYYEKVGPCHVVVDLMKAISVDRKSREVFNTASKTVFGDRVIHNYYRFTPLFSILLKAFSYLNKDFNKKVTIVKSSTQTISRLIKDEAVEPTGFINELTNRTLSIDEINGMDRETLINYVTAMQQEMFSYRKLNEERIDTMLQGLSKISWNHDYESNRLPELPETDDYHQLYHTINFIQEDIGELVEELRNANSNLEHQVRERTSEISQKESNLRSIIENFNTPIWLVDSDYRILEFNSIFERNIKNEFNLPLEKGQNILDVFPKEIAIFWKQRYDRCLAGEKKSYFEKYDFAEIGHLHFEVKTFPILFENEIKGVGIVAVDITELQKSKMELEENNKRLEKVNSELDSFIYRSSHDLRAPISSVKGLIQIAKMEEEPALKDDYLDKMRLTMDRLDGFIHEIMDITKNEKIDIQNEEIVLKPLIKKVLDELAHSEEVSKVRINISVDERLTFNSDPSRLKTLIKNILANSIKYRDEEKDSKIEITARKINKYVTLEIEDNGEGIPEESLPQITSMFYRAHPSKSGSGLGLYIVSEILTKLNGSIEIGSKEGEFTKVSISLPIN